MVAIWRTRPLLLLDASKVPEGRSSDGGSRAGSHAVRDSSNAPSDSWLLVYLRRVKLDYDDHDDLDGEAIKRKEITCMNGRAASTEVQHKDTGRSMN